MVQASDVFWKTGIENHSEYLLSLHDQAKQGFSRFVKAKTNQADHSEIQDYITSGLLPTPDDPLLPIFILAMDYYFFQV